MKTKEAIEDFLARRRIAFVGLSRNPADFSHRVLQKLLALNYDVVPVNPLAEQIAGLPSYPRVEAILPPVEGALIMTPPQTTGQVVRECAQAGITRVWIHRGGGQGAYSDEAVRYCHQAGMAVVAGECPLMFLGRPGIGHRLHALARRITGTYPC